MIGSRMEIDIMALKGLLTCTSNFKAKQWWIIISNISSRSQDLMQTISVFQTTNVCLCFFISFPGWKASAIQAKHSLTFCCLVLIFMCKWYPFKDAVYSIDLHWKCWLNTQTGYLQNICTLSIFLGQEICHIFFRSTHLWRKTENHSFKLAHWRED